MNEFIFGGLSTLERRVVAIQKQTAGVQHRYRLNPHTPRPDQSPTAYVTVEHSQTINRVVCQLQQPEVATIAFRPGQVTWDLLNWTYNQTWQADLPAYPAGTLVRYQIVAYPAGGGQPIAADNGATFSYLVGTPGYPAWAAEAIIYQVFPDRFHPGRDHQWRKTQSLSDIFGGTLRGIIENLDYIADLGFNCIWLNPFFPDTTHHGYHASDYFQVNPRLGSLADIKELVDKAHALGMRMLLDFVANHWGSDHDTFQSAVADPHSSYRDWYLWQEWPHDYQTFFGVKELPKVNLADPGARAYMLKAAAYWLSEMDFDGYRLDYALGPELDFWTEFRAVCKATRPDAWLFGEVVETPIAQRDYEGRLDGCLDFVLAQALRDTFAFNTMNVAAFDAFLGLHEQFFPSHFSRPSFLDNHDMNRFLWLARGDKRRLQLAALCQFTLAGPPIVYYGTEVGLSQLQDIAHPNGRHIMEESRLPMLWGAEQDHQLHAYYRQLIHFRRQHPALWHGRRDTVWVDVPAGTYAYTRTNDQEQILVALNLSDHQQNLTLANQTITLPPYSGDCKVLIP